MTNIAVSLPHDLARQAQSAGLLRDDVIAALLREAMKKRQVDALFVTIDRLSALEPRLTEQEIDDEIAAARSQRARRR